MDYYGNQSAEEIAYEYYYDELSFDQTTKTHGAALTILQKLGTKIIPILRIKHERDKGQTVGINVRYCDLGCIVIITHQFKRKSKLHQKGYIPFPHIYFASPNQINNYPTSFVGKPGMLAVVANIPIRELKVVFENYL